MEKASRHVSTSANIAYQRTAVPAPPVGLLSDEQQKIVIAVWRRFENWRSGREFVQGAAYATYTIMLSAVGGRGSRRVKDAAARFNLDPAIMSRLGEISSMAGDPHTTRKVRDSAPLQSEQERELEVLFEAVVAHIIEHERGLRGPPLSLAAIARFDRPARRSLR